MGERRIHRVARTGAATSGWALRRSAVSFRNSRKRRNATGHPRGQDEDLAGCFEVTRFCRYNRQAAIDFEHYDLDGVRLPRAIFIISCCALAASAPARPTGRRVRAARRHRGDHIAGRRGTKRQRCRRRQDSCAARDRMGAAHELRGIAAVGSGLEVCEVLEAAPDHSWQRIRQVMNYSWYLPKLSYQIRVDLRSAVEDFDRTHIRRCTNSERSMGLQGEGEYTVAHYVVDLEPGILGAALVGSVGSAARSAEAAACAAHPCRNH